VARSQNVPSWPDLNGATQSQSLGSPPSGGLYSSVSTGQCPGRWARIRLTRQRQGGVGLPRHTYPARRQKRSTSKPERGGSSRRQRISAHEIDAQALALREAGSSFSAIARMLELERAVEAHRCFVRALNALDGKERHQLVVNEEGRLGRLEERIRDRDAADAAKVAWRLRGVTNLREAIAQ
jgi:hypothetical protein